MKIAYVRVSTIEQSEGRQLEGLKKFNIDKWFTEKVSVKDTKNHNFKVCYIFQAKGILYNIYMGL